MAVSRCWRGKSLESFSSRSRQLLPCYGTAQQGWQKILAQKETKALRGCSCAPRSLRSPVKLVWFNRRKRGGRVKKSIALEFPQRDRALRYLLCNPCLVSVPLTPRVLFPCAHFSGSQTTPLRPNLAHADQEGLTGGRRGRGDSQTTQKATTGFGRDTSNQKL